jgi:nucleolar protein 9
VCNAFELFQPKDRSHLVSCVLVLKPLGVTNFFKLHSDTELIDISKEYMATGPTKHILEDAQQGSKKGKVDDSKEPKVQGALILQSLLCLNEPHCMMVTERWVRR